METTLTFTAIIIAVIAAALFLGRQQTKRDQEALRETLKRSFFQVPDKKIPAERMEKIPAYFLRHKEETAIDDITWNDLDLDQLYKRIDNTQSAAGEEYLYYVLRTPALSQEEQDARFPAKALAFYADPSNEQARLLAQQSLHRLGHAGKYSLYDYLDLLESLGERSNRRNYLALILPFLALFSMNLSVQIGMVLLIASLLLNLLTYFQEKREIEPYIVSFRYLLRLMDCADHLTEISSQMDALQADLEALDRANKSFAKFRRFSSLAMGSSTGGSGNPIDLVLDYVRILFHLDLIKFNNMLREVQGKRESIDSILTIVGRIDALIAAASFWKSLPISSTPVFREDAAPYLEVTDLIHPLLASPVPNTIDAKRSVLLTGSNASGKSTFLKAVAIAALLSQTLGITPAKAYTATRFQLYSSMALRDNMQEGDSYFMVEIKSLKRICDAAAREQAAPVLCFIDEVLRGTNTVERIAASTEILSNLAAQGNVLCFAATHDLELTELLTGYVNYHFEEEIREREDGRDVVFSYQLKDGRATSRNAIALLSQIGFAEDVTRRALSRAKAFEESGRWQ